MISISRQYELAQEVLDNYDDIAIPYGDIEFKFGVMESTKAYGYCYNKNNEGKYVIEINKHIDSERIFKQTLAHEVIHTIDGCQNHDRVKSHKGFHYWAELINKELADCEYNIDTHVTELDDGVNKWEDSISKWKLVSPMGDGYVWYARTKTTNVKRALMGVKFKDTCKELHDYTIYNKKHGSWVLVRESEMVLNIDGSKI